MEEIKLNELKCKVCGHKWVARKQNIRQCPRCRTIFWQTGKPIPKWKKEGKKGGKK